MLEIVVDSKDAINVRIAAKDFRKVANEPVHMRPKIDATSAAGNAAPMNEKSVHSSAGATQ